jgi:hypothetical protein
MRYQVLAVPNASQRATGISTGVTSAPANSKELANSQLPATSQTSLIARKALRAELRFADR